MHLTLLIKPFFSFLIMQETLIYLLLLLFLITCRNHQHRQCKTHNAKKLNGWSTPTSGPILTILIIMGRRETSQKKTKKKNIIIMLHHHSSSSPSTRTQHRPLLFLSLYFPFLFPFKIIRHLSLGCLKLGLENRTNCLNCPCWEAKETERRQTEKAACSMELSLHHAWQ